VLLTVKNKKPSSVLTKWAGAYNRRFLRTRLLRKRKGNLLEKEEGDLTNGGIIPDTREIDVETAWVMTIGPEGDHRI